MEIKTTQSPAAVLADCFPSIGGLLPIEGGWGYSRDSACIIVAPAQSERPFDYHSVENVFVEKRTYLELIVTRPPEERCYGIQWTRVAQQLTHQDGRWLDNLEFEVTAFSVRDWNDLRSEWEGPEGVASPGFDLEAHERRRAALQQWMRAEFWFEVTAVIGRHHIG